MHCSLVKRHHQRLALCRLHPLLQSQPFSDTSETILLAVHKSELFNRLVPSHPWFFKHQNHPSCQQKNLTATELIRYQTSKLLPGSDQIRNTKCSSSLPGKKSKPFLFLHPNCKLEICKGLFCHYQLCQRGRLNCPLWTL